MSLFSFNQDYSNTGQEAHEKEKIRIETSEVEMEERSMIEIGSIEKGVMGTGEEKLQTGKGAQLIGT